MQNLRGTNIKPDVPDGKLVILGETFHFHQERIPEKKDWLPIKSGSKERFYRSYNKKAFVRALNKLIPEVTADDLEPGGAGVRAQACLKDGSLLDDFYIVEDKKVVHVCNAPSPAATASLAIGDYISDKVLTKV